MVYEKHEYRLNHQAGTFSSAQRSNLGDPTFGWRPIITYAVDFDSNDVITAYYYPIPEGGAGEPLFENATNTKIGWLTIKQLDNSCQPYPGEIPTAAVWTSEYIDGGYQYTNGPWTWLTGQWTTIIDMNDSIPCDGIVDYCGPAISLTQHEGAYDFYSIGTIEKWWFSNDPTGKQPRMLKKVHQTESNGSPDDITMRHTARFWKNPIVESTSRFPFACRQNE